MKMKNKSKGMEGESGCDVKLVPGLLRRYVALTTQRRREKLKEKRSIRVEGKFLAFFSPLHEWNFTQSNSRRIINFMRLNVNIPGAGDRLHDETA